MELTTGENDSGRRLDRILRKALKDHPLSLIHRILRKGQVYVNGKRAKPEDRVESGSVISIKGLMVTKVTDTNMVTDTNLVPLWQNETLIAFNKPAGLAVHGENSLEIKVRSYLSDKLPPSLSFTPGPLHRLDKPSSGIVVFPKSLEGARLFTSLLKEHKIKKTYLAITEGEIINDEVWEDKLIRDHNKKKTFIDRSSSLSQPAKKAITKIAPISSKNGYSLIKAEIITGRTHQIRAQAASHGYPLLGDVKYREQKAPATKFPAESKEQLAVSRDQRRIKKKLIVDFFLHAWRLEFLEYKIKAPLPPAFEKKLREIFGDVVL